MPDFVLFHSWILVVCYQNIVLYLKYIFAYDKLYCVHVFLYLINKIVEQLWLKIPAICFLFQGYYYTVTIPRITHWV